MDIDTFDSSTCLQHLVNLTIHHTTSTTPLSYKTRESPQYIPQTQCLFRHHLIWSTQKGLQVDNNNNKD